MSTSKSGNEAHELMKLDTRDTNGKGGQIHYYQAGRLGQAPFPHAWQIDNLENKSTQL